jgi:molybdate transport system substrate-binding protein
MRVVLLVAAASISGVTYADEIRIAVAANFVGVMETLIARYEAAGDHVVLLSSGSTGGHYAQIRNGAPFDAFFAADVRRPALLEEEGRIVPGSRFTYAVGRIALWSREAGYVDAEGGVLETGTFRFLAIANPELAPYGAAACDTLRALGLWERLESRLVQGQDITQTFSFVYTQSAELGFVAYSQLRAPDRPIEGSHWLVPASLHEPIEQQAVLLNDVPAAREFLEFVRSPEGKDIIRGYGYGP